MPRKQRNVDSQDSEEEEWEGSGEEGCEEEGDNGESEEVYKTSDEAEDGEWPTPRTANIIRLWKQRPHMWDPGARLFYKASKKAATYAEMAAKVNLPGEYV